ncbi:LemA family protein [Candidatus Woesearchaeota archaeon]|nr:MAG: LemA family protein [Candidatus Woesearchaeota archaeon]
MAKQSSNNSKWWGIGALAVIAILALWVGGTYNSFVSLEENTNNMWGRVQTAYQRRADLIPNLVSTVKQYTDYEGPLLKEITQARASVGQARTPEQLQKAGAEMNSALSRLLLVAENYPNLKANEQFLDLQVQLEGTENRIKVERDAYNNAVRAYNVKARKFPSNIIAGLFGFEQKEYFKADEGSEKAPDVSELFQ